MFRVFDSGLCLLDDQINLSLRVWINRETDEGLEPSLHLQQIAQALLLALEQIWGGGYEVGVRDVILSPFGGRMLE